MITGDNVVEKPRFEFVDIVEHPEFERVLLEHFMDVSLKAKNLACNGISDRVEENFSEPGKSPIADGVNGVSVCG